MWVKEKGTWWAKVVYIYLLVCALHEIGLITHKKSTLGMIVDGEIEPSYTGVNLARTEIL